MARSASWSASAGTKSKSRDGPSPFVHRGLFSANEIRRRLLMRRGTTNRSSWQLALGVFDERCAYCGVADLPLQRDHVVPLSRGGFDIPANVVPACADCNASKGDHDVRWWMRANGYDLQLFVLRWLQLRRAS